MGPDVKYQIHSDQYVEEEVAVEQPVSWKTRRVGWSIIVASIYTTEGDEVKRGRIRLPGLSARNRKMT